MLVRDAKDNILIYIYVCVCVCVTALKCARFQKDYINLLLLTDESKEEAHRILGRGFSAIEGQKKRNVLRSIVFSLERLNNPLLPS